MSTSPDKSTPLWDELRQQLDTPPWWTKLLPGAARQHKIMVTLMNSLENLSRQTLGKAPDPSDDAYSGSLADGLADLHHVCAGFNQTLLNHQTHLIQVEKSLEVLPHLEHRLNDLHRLKQSLAEVAAQVSALIGSFSAFDSRMLQSENRFQHHERELQARQQSLADQAEHQQTEQNSHREKLEQLAALISTGDDKMTDCINELDQLKNNASQFEVSLSAINATLNRTRQTLEDLGKELNLPSAKQRTMFDKFYLAFENEFRGTMEQIRDKQAGYLATVNAIKERCPVRHWIDLGCGRGEWLHALNAEGMKAQGIDNSPTMIASCTEQGLNAVEVDAIFHLGAQADGSAAGISAFHLVEHITPHDFLSLINEAHRVLAPGGCLIFETPNPQNISVGACNFYMDPTHRNPVTPMTAEFMVRNAGFSGVEVLRLSPMTKLGDKEELASTPVEREYFDYFYGPQDFAIIATK